MAPLISQHGLNTAMKALAGLNDLRGWDVTPFPADRALMGSKAVVVGVADLPL